MYINDFFDAEIDALDLEALSDQQVAEWLIKEGLAEKPILAENLNVDEGWEKAIETVVKSEDFIKFMKNRGYGIYYLNSADFAKALTQADKDNGEIMKAAGIAK